MFLAEVFDFYSRAPCEARLSVMTGMLAVLLFLLTRPLRGATLFGQIIQHNIKFLLTRPLRGATQYDMVTCPETHNFYSRAPCEARRIWEYLQL